MPQALSLTEKKSFSIFLVNPRQEPQTRSHCNLVTILNQQPWAYSHLANVSSKIRAKLKENWPGVLKMVELVPLTVLSLCKTASLAWHQKTTWNCIIIIVFEAILYGVLALLCKHRLQHLCEPLTCSCCMTSCSDLDIDLKVSGIRKYLPARSAGQLAPWTSRTARCTGV